MKLGIISDIHEDVVRLEMAISMLEKLDCDEIACLGDIVGFGYPHFGFFETRDANRCIAIVKSNCKFVVIGNHDLFPIKRIPEFNAGFAYPANWYELDYTERKKIAGDEVWLNEEIEFNALIGKKEKDYLMGLPEYAVVNAGERSILLSHYLFPDLSGSHRKYYENFGPVEAHLSFMGNHNCLFGFSGHKHVEGILKFEKRSKQKFNFRKIGLGPDMQWIIGPCIANGKHKNGFMMFDTVSCELHVIPLNTPKRIMQTINLN